MCTVHFCEFNKWCLWKYMYEKQLKGRRNWNFAVAIECMDLYSSSAVPISFQISLLWLSIPPPYLLGIQQYWYTKSKKWWHATDYTPVYILYTHDVLWPWNQVSIIMKKPHLVISKVEDYLEVFFSTGGTKMIVTGTLHMQWTPGDNVPTACYMRLLLIDLKAIEPLNKQIDTRTHTNTAENSHKWNINHYNTHSLKSVTGVPLY